MAPRVTSGVTPRVPPDDPGGARADGRPLVSVLITAHDRPDELRATLRALRRQDYPALELLVIDDASAVDLGAVVRDEWPEARFRRNDRNLGYIVGRSLGMARATGKYILSLDDDSHPVRSDAIARAVERFERELELGVIAFRVHEGTDPPEPGPAPPEQYTFAFVGCGVMIRSAVARAVGGYRDYFEYYKEEAEYALRVIDGGYRVLYVPELVVHHRLSAIGRSSARIAAYSFRNAIWTAVLTAPPSSLAVEAPWKAVIGAVEMARQGSVRWFAWGLWSTLRGLPRVVRDRAPLSPAGARAYQAVRYRQIRTAEALVDARAPSWRERGAWFRDVWLRRRRPRAAWDRREGGIGDGAWTTRARWR